MKYTHEMEKAMEQSHGMSYSEYERKLSNRMMVEKRREKDYEKSKLIVAQATTNIHK